MDDKEGWLLPCLPSLNPLTWSFFEGKCTLKCHRGIGSWSASSLISMFTASDKVCTYSAAASPYRVVNQIQLQMRPAENADWPTISIISVGRGRERGREGGGGRRLAFSDRLKRSVRSVGRSVGLSVGRGGGEGKRIITF